MAKKTTKKKAVTKPKRLVRGKDWHAWAWEYKYPSKTAPFDLKMETYKPAPRGGLSRSGKWVKAKIVKV